MVPSPSEIGLSVVLKVWTLGLIKGQVLKISQVIKAWPPIKLRTLTTFWKFPTYQLPVIGKAPSFQKFVSKAKNLTLISINPNLPTFNTTFKPISEGEGTKILF